MKSFVVRSSTHASRRPKPTRQKTFRDVVASVILYAIDLLQKIGVYLGKLSNKPTVVDDIAEKTTTSARISRPSTAPVLTTHSQAGIASTVEVNGKRLTARNVAAQRDRRSDRPRDRQKLDHFQEPRVTDLDVPMQTRSIQTGSIQTDTSEPHSLGRELVFAAH